MNVTEPGKTDNATGTAGELHKAPLPWGRGQPGQAASAWGPDAPTAPGATQRGRRVPRLQGPKPRPPPGTLIRDGGQGAASWPRPSPPRRDARSSAGGNSPVRTTRGTSVVPPGRGREPTGSEAQRERGSTRRDREPQASQAGGRGTNDWVARSQTSPPDPGWPTRSQSR